MVDPMNLRQQTLVYIVREHGRHHFEMSQNVYLSGLASISQHAGSAPATHQTNYDSYAILWWGEGRANWYQIGTASWPQKCNDDLIFE